MTHSHFVKSARKNYPNEGIKKGEPYYWWAFRYGGKHRSKIRPERSQLTQSEFLSRIWSLEDNALQSIDCAEDCEGVLSELEDIYTEEENKKDELNEGFKAGHIGELLEERYELSYEMWTDLDNLKSDLEGVEGDIETKNNELQNLNSETEDDGELETIDNLSAELTDLEVDRNNALEEIKSLSYQGN
ncbi:hypothetical protein LCGC14_0337340 [marine sediment metagenome]|uniref:Uncharacterized protein n=1 Tax=marine sediment metagenome TaxID=412755 RepID=A0A0F9TXM6_9ZZZZ